MRYSTSCSQWGVRLRAFTDSTDDDSTDDAWAVTHEANGVPMRSVGASGRDGTPVTVLEVAHYYPPHVGGIEVVCQRIAQTLSERGYRIDVFTSAVGGESGVADEKGVSVSRIRAYNPFERYGVPFPLFGPTFLVRAWRLVARSDVVHVHDTLYVSSWVTAVACRILDRPYVVTVHVGEVYHPRAVIRLLQSVVRASLGALVAKGAGRVMPISPAIESDVVRQYAGVRTDVLPNGVDTEEFRPADEAERRMIKARYRLTTAKPLVLFVGRFVPKKGFAEVCAATSDRYQLVFVGDSRPEGVEDADERCFLGRVSHDEISDLYRACDVFVCASVGEGPMTVMEAMSSGLPVVLNDDPALRGLNFHGAGVRFVPMGSGALKDTLEDLVSDPARLRDLGDEARQEVLRHHSWDSYVDRLVTILREVQNEKVRKP